MSCFWHHLSAKPSPIPPVPPTMPILIWSFTRDSDINLTFYCPLLLFFGLLLFQFLCCFFICHHYPCFFLKNRNKTAATAPIVTATIISIAKPTGMLQTLFTSSPFMPYTLEMNVSGNNIAEKYRQRLDRVLVRFDELDQLVDVVVHYF